MTAAWPPSCLGSAMGSGGYATAPGAATARARHSRRRARRDDRRGGALLGGGHIIIRMINNGTWRGLLPVVLLWGCRSGPPVPAGYQGLVEYDEHVVSFEV